MEVLRDMSVFDRLEGYSAQKGYSKSGDMTVKDDGHFDLKSSEGMFLSLVHKLGFKMYDADGNDTELKQAICASGNQKVQATAGSGKALVNGTGVLTPNGFVAIETLRVGDLVYGTDGEVHHVLGVFPQGLCSAYEVTFSDDTVIPCNGEHLWGTSEGNVVKTTDLKRGTTLPIVHPVRFVEADVPVPFDVMGKALCGVTDSHEDYWKEHTGYRNSLPEDYLYGSVKQRSVLLNAVLNTKGTLSCALIRDFRHILCSLGYVPLRYKKGADVKQWIRSSMMNDRKRKVKSVKATHSREPMTCISVDSDDKLFITEGFVPTHNTTMLLFKIMHDIVTGELMCNKVLPNGAEVRIVDRVFVGTFLRSGAKELQQKLAKWQGSMGYSVTATQIQFGTLHAEFKRCLNDMNIATPIADSGVLNGLMRKAINSCNIQRNDGGTLKAEDYKIIEGVITYYRGRLDKLKYNHPNALDYGLTPSILDLLVKQYSSLKQAKGVMDFDDLQELLYKYIYVSPNPAVQDFVANRYKYMYLDEFQDTSQIQYALIKAYMRECSKEYADVEGMERGKIVVVGDVEQCIYSFRGSDIEVMHTEFDNDFDSVHSSLSYNYRCPSNILNPVIPSIELNRESVGIEIKPYAEGGTFGLYGHANYKSMLSDLGKGIASDISLGETCGILCRTNYDGMIPALYLAIQRVYDFSISSNAMTLSSPLPKRLIKVASILTDRGTPALKDTLSMFVPYTRQYSVKTLCDVLKTNRKRVWEIPIEDIEYSCPDIVEIVKRIKMYREQAGDVQALQAVYFYLKQHVFDRDNSYCDSARAIIEVLLFLIEERNIKTMSDFKEEVDLLDESLYGRVGKKADIRVATVHEFKGKECDNIYIWNDSEGVFPTNKTDLNDVNGVEEERRVHYIACTRAKKKSIILFQSDKPSMFVKELDAKIEYHLPDISGSIGKGVIS